MQTSPNIMDETVKIDATSMRMQRNKSNDSDSYKSKTSMPTSNPNEYDPNAIAGFGFNSMTSRSFVRPSKSISQEHRNVSVPNSLKVD